MTDQQLLRDIVAAQNADGIVYDRGSCDGALLRDLGNDYPALRLHLLGHSSEDAIVHCGSMFLARTERSLRIRLHKPALQYQATVEGDSFFGLLEVLENDLRSGSLDWQPDYRLSQLRRREQSRKVNGS